MKWLFRRGGNAIMSQYSLTHDTLAQLCILKNFKLLDIGLNKHLPFWCSIQVEPKAVLESYPFITERGMWDLPSEPFQLDQLWFVALGRKTGIFSACFQIFPSQNVFALLASFCCCCCLILSNQTKASASHGLVCDLLCRSPKCSLVPLIPNSWRMRSSASATCVYKSYFAKRKGSFRQRHVAEFLRLDLCNL